MWRVVSPDKRGSRRLLEELSSWDSVRNRLRHYVNVSFNNPLFRVSIDKRVLLGYGLVLECKLEEVSVLKRYSSFGGHALFRIEVLTLHLRMGPKVAQRFLMRLVVVLF